MDTILLIGSPKTVIIASVTTITFKESVHHLLLYHFHKENRQIITPKQAPKIIRVSNTLTTQAQPISSLSERLISHSI